MKRRVLILYIVALPFTFFGMNNPFLYKNKLPINNSIISANLDTISLNIFWKDFKENVKENNRSKVINCLDFPIRAYYFVLFNYSINCDVLLFNKNEKKYSNVLITKKNINQYYEFVFNDSLKMIIEQINIKDLLKSKISSKETNGLVYRIFPRNFIKVQCYNDHNLKLYVYQKNKCWKVGFVAI